LFCIAVAAATLVFGGAQPAAAQTKLSPDRQLVLEVPHSVMDDLVSVGRSTNTSGGIFPPELDLSVKFCGTYECLCIDVEPEECVPDAAELEGHTVWLTSSVRTQAVIDLVARELKSGKHSTVIVRARD
jgi:hypothetical protein